VNRFSIHRIYALKIQVLLGALICFLLLPGPAGSQTPGTDDLPSLSATIEKNTARIGDMLWLTFTYQIPQGAQLPDDASISGLETLTVVEHKAEPNQIQIRFMVDQLESFNLGPFSLTYINDGNNEQQLTTDPIAITILSNLGEKPEEAALKPIEDIISTKTNWLTYLLWALSLILLTGFVFLFIWWRKRRRIRDIQATMQDPPHVRAEKEIDKLIASGLFETGNVKAFYFNFSETIRRYMESIRSFPAAEMTTEEIARWVNIDPSDQKILPLLRQADLVKFADSIPAPDRKDQDILTARTYIQQTRPMANDPQESPAKEVRP